MVIEWLGLLPNVDGRRQTSSPHIQATETGWPCSTGFTNSFPVSNRIQVRPLFAPKSDPSDGAKIGVAEPHIAEQSRSWRAASGERWVMRGS